MSCQTAPEKHSSSLLQHSTDISPHLPDNTTNCCFPFRTTLVLLFFQNHISTHWLELVFSHPSIAVSMRAHNVLPLAATTHEKPRRSACCCCSSLSSVFFIPPHYSPHTLSNCVNISSVTCSNTMPLRAFWIFPLLNYDSPLKVPISHYLTPQAKKNHFQHISTVWSQLNPLTAGVVGCKEDGKPPSVTFRGIEHKFL